jgi:cytochrome P450
MANTHTPDWDPLAPEILDDQQRAHDQMRDRCPVAWSDFLGWSLFKHEDVIAVARDPTSFSNRVSASPMLKPGSIPSIPLQLPVQSLCAFLGWPADDWRQLKAWSSDIERAALRRDPERGRRATDALHAYILRFIYARRQHPRADVTSWLLESEREEKIALDDARKISILRLLLHAGHGTTTASLGLCLLYLACHQDDQMYLRENPDRIPAAAEEILRHDGPLVSTPRVLTRDIELRGRRLEAGDRVALMFAAAGRDPEAFPDAERCRLGRSPNRHLIFGNGIHFCSGARLARLELRVALEELSARTKGFRLAGPEPRRFRWPGNGPRSLPLHITLE